MLTMSFIQQYVRSMLGGGKVNVEIDEDHVRTAIKGACDYFNMYRPAVLQRRLPAVNTEYIITPVAIPGLPDALVLPGFMAVRDVVPMRQITDDAVNNRINLFDPLLYIMQTQNSVDASLGQYAMALSGLEEAKRVYGQMPAWNAQREIYTDTSVPPDKDFVVTRFAVSGASTGTRAHGLVYTCGYSPTNDVDGVGLVPPHMESTFLSACVAGARGILGSVRNKHRGIPTPDGGTSELDGYTQVRQALDEWDKVERTVKSPTLRPLIG